MISYERQKHLVKQGLATVKTDGIFDTFKYSRKVMFENLWKQYPDTMHCRGHVYDNRNGNPVQNPPSKSFNYLENGWWNDVPLSTEVRAFKKYNGFMAAATIYEGELVVSTTGTTNSDYAKLAREKIMKFDAENRNFMERIMEGYTNVYEIVDESDPHIVDEKPGVYFLGDSLVDVSGANYTAFYPQGDFIEGTLDDILEIAKSVEHEGYMVWSGRNVCKVKSPYYTFKKKLMRMSDKNVDVLYDKPFYALESFDQKWFTVGMTIKNTQDKEFWKALTDQQRRTIIETIYENL